MAYTSGRTVKSNAKKANPFTDATRTAQRLAVKLLPATARPTVTTDRAYVGDMTEMARTTITFPEGTDDAALAAAIIDLPRYHSMRWNSCSITYLTDLEG
jgi:hypothetical protein